MRIHVSGPPVDSLEEREKLHAVIYRTIWEITYGKHEVVFPLRTLELSKLDPKDFFEAMRSRIGNAEAVISVFVAGDQSTPVEFAVAASQGLPQTVLEVDIAPRLIRGLPHIVEVVKISPKAVQTQVKSAVERLTGLVRARAS